MQNFGVRVRLVVLVLALAAMGALIAALIWNFQHETVALRARLASIDSESGQIAAQFKDRFREVTNARMQYAVSEDPAAWQRFLAADRALSEWIDQRARDLTTEEERDILAQVKTAYRGYQQTIGAIPGEPNARSTTEDRLAAYTQVRTESQHLFDLGESLAAAHYRSRDSLVAETRYRLGTLQRSLLGLVGVVFILGALLAIVAYRDMIAPLRVQLVESRSLAERQEKLASLGMLAAGVAHEIRNPLTAIKAALFIQQKRLQPGTQAHADGEVVQREIARLERIVTDFLRFARPADPQRAPVSPQILLREVRDFFLPAMTRPDIRLEVEPGDDALIEADAAQLKQVLINLVQNAIDSVGTAGTVTLRSRNEQRILAGSERDVVILEVADTGKGIAPEVGKRLFDPFFTTKDHGTGLGLAIAARIVEKHQGALQYQTQINRGTTFGVVLPRVSP